MVHAKSKKMFYDQIIVHNYLTKWESLKKIQWNNSAGAFYENKYGFQPLTISTKSSILDVWLGSECVNLGKLSEVNLKF